VKGKTAVPNRFVQWCAKQPWDYGLRMVVPIGMAATKIEGHFRQLMLEIEEADGSLDFRWVRFVPKDPQEGLTEFYALIGGTNSGEWWYWGRRWREIVGDPEAMAGFAYDRRRRRFRLQTALKELLAGKRFSVEMRIGPKTIRRGRTLNVDEEGYPLGSKRPVPNVGRKRDPCESSPSRES